MQEPTLDVRDRDHTRLDRCGMVASGLCAAHCALAALVPTAFAALGLGVLVGHEAEWAFTAIAIAIAVGALALSWRRHRSRVVAGLLLLGIVGLLGSRAIEMSAHHDHGDHGHGTAVGVMSGLLLLGGHVVNIRTVRRRNDG